MYGKYAGKYAYITNEMGSSVTPIKIDISTGAMSVCGPTLPTTPEEWFKGMFFKTCASILTLIC